MRGPGPLPITAIGSTGLRVVAGATRFAAFLITFANVLVGVVYASLDPRVALG